MAITGIGTYQDYSYGQQTITVPYTGLYKIEAWGASGCWVSGLGGTPGYGGYACGYKSLNAGDTFYAYVGSQGGDTGSGGLNGGGWGGGDSAGNNRGGGGGGATHVGTRPGTLAEYGNTNGLWLVAGGGGGVGRANTGQLTKNGGGGGGSSGSAGTFAGHSSTAYGGGSQSAAGGGTIINWVNAGGAYQTYYGGFGYGMGTNTVNVGGYPLYSGGGGGGLYGGGTADYSGGCGGSGYIGGVPTINYDGTNYGPSWANNVKTSHGMLRITLVATPSRIYFNGTKINSVYINGGNVNTVVFNNSIFLGG